jgi:peptidoglycan/LPS O-acetylase OafA/YrhL
MKECLVIRNDELNPADLINVIFISIVLFLHHSSYTINYFSWLNIFCGQYLLQKFAVGGFFFFSGLKLVVSNINYTGVCFLKKRFFRIYILYLIALSFASFTYYPFFNNGNYPNFGNILLHAFCLQTILPNLFGNNYLTIWFVSILVFCYVIFIWVRNDLPTTYFYIKCLLLYFIISTLYLLTFNSHLKLFTRDFAIYLMFFLLGVHSAVSGLRLKNKYWLIIALLSSVLLIALYKIVDITTWYEYHIYSFLVLIGNVSLFKLLCNLLKRISFSKKTVRFISKYSFASYCIFLFHRQIWCLFNWVYPEKIFLQWLLIVVCGIPVIIVSSYYIQYFYNKIIIKFQC